MDAERQAFLDDLGARGRAFDATQEDRLDRLRNVEPETAELLGVLVRSLRARRVLELGTSNGFSTGWLADAAEAVGGRVVSVDLDPERTGWARENLEGAGLSDVVELRTEDAGQTLAAAPDGSADLIFLDAERPLYAGYWPELVRVLASPGMLAVDNALSHAEQLEEFSALVRADARVASSLVPIGAGVLLISHR